MSKRISSRAAAARKATHGEQVYSEEGVDLTLIRWMLSLTPAERLQVLQQSARSLTRLRRDRERV
jgi:hypothetical protein